MCENSNFEFCKHLFEPADNIFYNFSFRRIDKIPPLGTIMMRCTKAPHFSAIIQFIKSEKSDEDM